MNIVVTTPIANGYPTNNQGTESARRDNVQRESIPAIVQNQKSAAEKGVADKQEPASQNAFTNPTYDKPNVGSPDLTQSQSAFQDNAERESAGKQDAQDKQQEQADNEKVRELRARDQEVRLHEQAHASVGGRYAGSPSYEYERGPDGKRYAVGGEVQIDVSEAKDPEQTIRKMQQVKAAALAPAEPSPQDYKVANEATQKEQRARTELSQQRLESQSPNTGDEEAVNTRNKVISNFYGSVSQSRTFEISMTA